jgi:hypothetical protein
MMLRQALLWWCGVVERRCEVEFVSKARRLSCGQREISFVDGLLVQDWGTGI